MTTEAKAKSVDYDNSGSGLAATDVQAAIDEVNTVAGTGLLSTNNLSDVASAATAFNNIKQVASESVAGVVELGTQAEIDAENASKAVTGATLAGAFTRSEAESGYVTLPGGLIIQWGHYTIANGDSDAWVSGGNYPIAFPNNCFIVNGSLAGDGGASTDNFMAVRKDATTPLVNFEYYTNNLPLTNRIAFIAIGN